MSAHEPSVEFSDDEAYLACECGWAQGWGHPTHEPWSKHVEAEAALPPATPSPELLARAMSSKWGAIWAALNRVPFPADDLATTILSEYARLSTEGAEPK